MISDRKIVEGTNASEGLLRKRVLIDEYCKRSMIA